MELFNDKRIISINNIILYAFKIIFNLHLILFIKNIDSINITIHSRVYIIYIE